MTAGVLRISNGGFKLKIEPLLRKLVIFVKSINFGLGRIMGGAFIRENTVEMPRNHMIVKLRLLPKST